MKERAIVAMAGYLYGVVRPLDRAQLQREPSQPALAFAGWLSRKAVAKLLGLYGCAVDGAPSTLIVSLRPLCILNSRSTAAKHKAATGQVIVAAMT